MLVCACLNLSAKMCVHVCVHVHACMCVCVCVCVFVKENGKGHNVTFHPCNSNALELKSEK